MRRGGQSIAVGLLAISSFSENCQPSWGFQTINQLPSIIRRSRQRQEWLGGDNPGASLTLSFKAHHPSNSAEDSTETPKKLPIYNYATSHRTALCVIPPDEAWDTLQRARHFAQDATYKQWPPAIRLFHPFVPRSRLSNMALDFAKVVENHNIEPFSITLNRWSVMPLPETMMLDKTNDSDIEESDEYSILEEDEEYDAIQQLIASEEQRGKERKRQRELRLKRKQLAKEQAETGAIVANQTEAITTDATVLEEAEELQRTEESIEPSRPVQPPASPVYDEFNGPSMIALEPDEKSSRKLRKLRELIRRALLESYDPHTPAATLWDSSLQLVDEEHSEEEFESYVEELTSFRPLIPMGAFPTVDEAIAVAKSLKGLWDPLTFQVTDLHFISQQPTSRQSLASTDLYNLNFDPQQAEHDVSHLSSATSLLSSFRGSADDGRKTQQPPNPKVVRDTGVATFGCDALVMLMGEEIEMDEESNALLANLICEEGTPGGGDSAADKFDESSGESTDEVASLANNSGDADPNNSKKRNGHFLYEEYERKLDVNEGDWEELVLWLDGDDEDEDEEEMEIGTSLVMGRTHLFSGEKRIYAGMPASSTTEETDGTYTMGGNAGFWQHHGFDFDGENDAGFDFEISTAQR